LLAEPIYIPAPQPIVIPAPNIITLQSPSFAGFNKQDLPEGDFIYSRIFNFD
jgi:hypothetical protein